MVRTIVESVQKNAETKTTTINKAKAEKGAIIAISNKLNSKIITTGFFICAFV